MKLAFGYFSDELVNGRHFVFLKLGRLEVFSLSEWRTGSAAAYATNDGTTCRPQISTSSRTWASQRKGGRRRAPSAIRVN